MVLKVHNTLTRKREEFVPMHGRRVYVFVCGQTVYEDVHIGHAKTYVDFDVIVRWLKRRGYSTFYLMNITDIEDKIINRAKERGVDPIELAEHYTERFFEDMEAIGITQNVNLFPKTTDYIPEMIEQIQGLIEKGYAYVVDGDVYFHVPAFEDYTKLSRMNLEELGKHRIEPDPRKKSPIDFALWKASEPGELGWDSPWSRGRPGWHIEDTAMSISIFGPQYDLHGGGTDLIFPHHSNEIAQAEALTGKRPFVRYWLHSGLLNIRGEKMSKSLVNFITIREALERYDPEVLRLYLISTHYRKPIEYKEEGLEMARDRLKKLYNSLRNFSDLPNSVGALADDERALTDSLERKKRQFEEAMDDDFNTPAALTALFEISRELNVFASSHSQVNSDMKEKVISTFRELGWVFSILQEGEREPAGELVDSLVTLLMEVREGLRKGENWELSDEIRAKLSQLGIRLEDAEEGPKWRIE